MSHQPGRNVLVRIGDGAVSETFSEIGRLNLRRLKLRAAFADLTDRNSTNQWRELLGSGVRTARIEVAGLWRESAAEESMRAAFFTGQTPNFEFDFSRWGTLTGAFGVVDLDLVGNLEGDSTVAGIFESAGALTWQTG